MGISHKDFILLFVGRIAQEKNISFLIDAQKNIVSKYPNIKLVIVGDGPDILKLKQQASHKDCKNSVIFVGKVPLKDVPLYYHLADISVTASTTETQGLTVIESLASSTPVVCIDDDSFKNVIIDDVNGYTFKNKKQYIEIIFDLYENKDKLNRLKKQALISSNEHSSSRYTDKMLDVYNIAIENFKKQKLTLLQRIKKGVGQK